MARTHTSVRLWQTELFVAVIVVAILILSGSLSTGLKQTLSDMDRGEALRNAEALAERLAPDFPLTPRSMSVIRTTVEDHRSIYEDSIWVFDANGSVLVSAYDGQPPTDRVQAAFTQGLADEPSYSSANLVTGGWVIASKPIVGTDGSHKGVVVIGAPVTASLSILESIRNRLWITFWISLAVAGLLGFIFAEFIGRRMRSMSRAAAAIAGGDFEQRLATGFVPDEISDLAESYNQMAIKLGAAFSAVRDREREIVAVVESMAEGVVALDAGGAVRVINAEALRLFGISTGEPKTAAQLTQDRAALDVIATGLSGAAAAAEVTLGERTALLHCTPLLAETGVTGGAVLLITDVTEQRRIEAAQRRFVADASHEMRTPVAALKGMLELLADGAKDDEAVRDDFLSTMQLEVDRLGRLVTDLLTLAQLESGGFQLTLEAHSAQEMLAEVAAMMRPLAEKAGIALAVEVTPGDLAVIADRDRLVQLLIGFTDNALKHSPPGSTVHLRARAERGHATLEVADEGSGIPAEKLGRIFDRFYRADDSRSSRGAGLGLSIAREIAEAHGTTIRAQSAPGAGTCFEFDLPLA